jgi:hypothetical protein
MANGRHTYPRIDVENAKRAREAAEKRRATTAGWEAGGFEMLLHVVLDSEAWRRTSHTARSLLAAYYGVG